MKIQDALGYFGVVPFALSLLFFDVNILGTEVTGKSLFVFYSVAILSFLSGAIWQPNNSEVSTALISNLLCLLAIFAIFLPLGFALIWLASCYLLLWYTEHRMSQLNRIKRTSEYMTLRGKLTVTVVSIHLLALFNVST